MIGGLKGIEGLRWKGNIYRALAQSLLLMMLLYMVCRVSFYAYNIEFFPGMTFSRFGRIMLGGLRFDLSAVLYLNSLFILLLAVPIALRFRPGYQKILKYLFLVINSIGLAANVADTIYYEYTLRRTTLSILRQFENEKNGMGLMFQFLADYWYALLFWIVLVLFMAFLYERIKIEGPQIKHKATSYFGGTVTLLLIGGLVVAGMRGGFSESTRPITLSNAAQYATAPKDINLVLNTPFAILRTAKTPVIEKVNYFTSNEELEKLYTPLHLPNDSIPFEAKNVVVIILESFSKEFFGVYNRDQDGSYKGYTPFLDSLIGQSWAYQYSFANGRKSIDAMPSVICSIPSIEVPYVLSHYSGNRVNSLSGLLKEKGYYTAFFHGAPNGSMGFQAFANACDFQDYFGKDEYGNDDDYDGIWGIWDHKFLQFYAEKMNGFKEPFYTNFFSVSSHHPYNLPEDFKGKFKEGDLPIYKCIEYTDYSLKKFFESASKMPWYKNTIFVITADHASAQIRLPQYNSAWGYFSIPIFFFQPAANARHGFNSEIMQQIDIMPTVLGALHYDKPFVAFGRDIFHDRSRPFAFNYLDNIYQTFRGNYLLQFDGSKTIGLYDFKKDKFLNENLAQQLPDTVRQMELQLKAFIQQYNNRMVDDNLTVNGPLSPKRN